MSHAVKVSDYICSRIHELTGSRHVFLLSGGGMRAKILEGMAVGKVVLSTRLGMEGIDAADGRECLLAEAPADWLQAIRYCYDQKERLVEMGKNARRFCEQQFDHESLAAHLIESYRQLSPRNVKTSAIGEN